MESVVFGVIVIQCICACVTTDTLYKISIMRVPLFGSAPPAASLVDEASNLDKLQKILSSNSLMKEQFKDTNAEGSDGTDSSNKPLMKESFAYEALSSALSSACASPVDHINMCVGSAFVSDFNKIQELSVLASTESEGVFMLVCFSCS